MLPGLFETTLQNKKMIEKIYNSMLENCFKNSKQ